MLRLFVIFLVSAAAAAAIPVAYQYDPQAFRQLLGSSSGDSAEATAQPAEQPAVRPVAAPAQPDPAPLGRKVRIDADPRGHFVTDFKLNGRRVTAMIDTGATAVAINASTARRIGLAVTPADFAHRVATANGTARAAVVRIDELQVGKVIVNDIDALVLEDKALSATLIGMTFLQRLSKYSVEDGALLLVQ
jgi:aspartyl protease family protein